MRRKIVVLLGLMMALGIGASPAWADPCQEAEALGDRNEICRLGCWDEGSAEERARAEEANRAEALEAECEAQRHQEDREIGIQERREAARHRREWAHKPTVTLARAEEMARRAMHHTNQSNWWVDCDGGRINRTHWSCRIGFFYRCLRSRILVSGAGFKDGVPWYRTKGGRLRQCRV